MSSDSHQKYVLITDKMSFTTAHQSIDNFIVKLGVSIFHVNLSGTGANTGIWAI